MSKQSRKHYPEDLKRQILKRHLVDGVPVSDLCNEHKLNPAVFYDWQRKLFEGTLSDQRGGNGERRELEKKVEHLEEKLARKDRVIAEVTEEMVKTKKSLGEL
jgi:transposase-like protein